MSFQWPQMLWLLLAAPALAGGYVWILRRKKKSAIRYSNLGLVREGLGPGPGIRRHVPPALFLAGFTAIILAIARPIAVIPLLSNQQTVILAIDVSLSMRANDVDPNRISAAQAAARTFFEELPSTVRVGIVSFAGTASVVQPPTRSREDLLAAIDRLEMQRHTATGSGLLVSLATLLPDAGIDVESLTLGKVGLRRNAAALDPGRKAEKKEFTPVPPASYASGAIVLLSDGRRTMGPDPIEAARMAASRGVKVYTVGFGTAEGGTVDFGGWSMYMKLDEETLKQVAEITRAEYFHAGTAADLKKVYQQLTTRLQIERKDTEISALLTAVCASFILAAAVLSLLWFRN